MCIRDSLKLLIVLADIGHCVLAAILGALDIHRGALTGDEAAGPVSYTHLERGEKAALDLFFVVADGVEFFPLRIGERGAVEPAPVSYTHLGGYLLELNGTKLDESYNPKYDEASGFITGKGS